MFLEERHQAALDHTAQLLQEAANARLIRECRPAVPWWRRAIVWRPVRVTVHLPVLVRPQKGHST
jgi:hypothetical protein